MRQENGASRGDGSAAKGTAQGAHGAEWHIQTRVLVTMTALVSAVLLAVVLIFNLSVRWYIRSRVSTQLDSIEVSASENLRGGRGQRGERPFDEHPDKLTGTRGSAVVLAENGALLSVLHGEPEVGAELSVYFSGGDDLCSGVRKRLLTLDSGTYMVSVSDAAQGAGAYLVYYVDVSSITAFTDLVNRVLFGIVLAAGALSVILSRRLARSFSEPVRALSAFAEEIGAGNLEERELSFRDVEFRQLADAMNRMARELSREKRKQETFFQNVSHELRTPLTSIQGNAEGIVFGVMEAQAAGRVILSETEKLSGMVEDILYLGRMGRGVPGGAYPPLDLREVISLCVSEQRAEAQRQGIRFRFAFDDAPVPLPIREQDAQRLMGNLISNAIRYARCEVVLSCHLAPDAVCAAVRDDGPGVAAQDLPHIFERFYKGAGGRHGIGLSIVQSVAEAYHGTVSVRNDGGAVFELRFPVS